MPAKSQLQAAIDAATQRYIEEIITAVRQASIEELMTLTPPTLAVPAKRSQRRAAAETGTAAKRRGRPRKKGIPAPPVEAIEAHAPKAKKKRAWPICSVDGCETNVYMPSGKKKMCYKHHIEAGGKPSPLIKVKKKPAEKNSKKPESVAPPQPETAVKRPKTTLRKAETAGSGSQPQVK